MYQIAVKDPHFDACGAWHDRRHWASGAVHRAATVKAF
jgi:hypothetical protein